MNMRETMILKTHKHKKKLKTTTKIIRRIDFSLNQIDWKIISVFSLCFLMVVVSFSFMQHILFDFNVIAGKSTFSSYPLE